MRVGGESGDRGRECLSYRSCLWWCEPEADAAFAVDVDEEAIDELADELAMVDMDREWCVGTLPEEAALVLAMDIGRLDAADADAVLGVEDDEAYDECALAPAPGIEVEVEVELVEVDIEWPPDCPSDPEGTPAVR